jgi:hypothetical protein
MKHSLSKNGLSLSQAQSISNLCNQTARDIQNQLDSINNVSKSLVIGEKAYVETVGNPMPDNIVDLLIEKSELHATQAFLMENIRAKKDMLDSIKSEYPDFNLEEPKRGDLKTSIHIQSVDEEFGLSQLTTSEYNELLEVEAYASHIGQFIHKNGVLDKLRNELPKIKTLEWIEIEDKKKTPMDVVVHHTPDQLLNIHNELAAKHRQYEQKVNYYKAKIKDLTTMENARIARLNAESIAETNAHNAIVNNEYHKVYEEFERNIELLTQEFEAKRQDRIKEVSELRINVDSRFQKVIDRFLSQLN